MTVPPASPTLAPPARWLRRVISLVEDIRRHEDRLALVLSLVIGALVGLVVVAFVLLTGRLAAHMYPAGAGGWRRIVVPTLGALVSGILLYRFFPDARGSGIPQTRAAIFIHDGRITLRTVVGKFVCCAASLASGIALGREGPSVHIGSGVASVIARRLGLSREQVRWLVPVGGAAALAAAFNTPIAAVLFSLEEIMGDLHAPILGSIVLSSTTAWMVLHLVLGDEPLFHVTAYHLVSATELLVYVVLGIVGGFGSVGFVKLLLGLRRRFALLPRTTVWWQPVVGGLTVGLLGYYVPAVLGVGYDQVDRVLSGDLVLRTVVLLAFLKGMATAVCYGSGNAGGVFGPSMFIGAMMGAAVGSVAHAALPATTAGAGAYALVGMGTAFAGIIRTPLTSVIMIFEVTRDYTIIVPLMISNMIAFYISQRLQPEPLYEALAKQDGLHLPTGEFRHHSRQHDVNSAIREAPEPLPPDLTLAEAFVRVGDSALRSWPVADVDGMLGMVRVSDIERRVGEGAGADTLGALLDALRNESGDATRAHAPAPSEFVHLHGDQPLAQALSRMGESGHTVLPVVSRANVRILLAVVTLDDVLRAYGVEHVDQIAHERSVPSASDTRAPGAPTASPREFLATFGLLFGLILAFLVLDLSLARVERNEARQHAASLYQEGRARLDSGQAGEAADRLSAAVSLDRTNVAYSLGLAQAMAAQGRAAEAEQMLGALLERAQNDGAVNVTMARLLATAHRPRDAVAYYHRAIYGRWGADSTPQRTAARFELIDLLVQQGANAEVLAELLPLQSDAADSTALLARVAPLYLRAAAPNRAVEAYRALIRRSPDDAAAYVGMGDAALALGQFLTARSAFREAARVKAGDTTIAHRLWLADTLLALDPTARGLSDAQRLRRSRELLALTTATIEACPHGFVTPLFSAARDSALVELRRQTPPGDLASGAERALTLAGAMWRNRARGCVPESTASSEVVVLLQRSLAR